MVCLQQAHDIRPVSKAQTAAVNAVAHLLAKDLQLHVAKVGVQSHRLEQGEGTLLTVLRKRLKHKYSRIADSRQSATHDTPPGIFEAKSYDSHSNGAVDNRPNTILDEKRTVQVSVKY